MSCFGLRGPHTQWRVWVRVFLDFACFCLILWRQLLLADDDVGCLFSKGCVFYIFFVCLFAIFTCFIIFFARCFNFLLIGCSRFRIIPKSLFNFYFLFFPKTSNQIHQIFRFYTGNERHFFYFLPLSKSNSRELHNSLASLRTALQHCSP